MSGSGSGMLDGIVAGGNRGHFFPWPGGGNWIECADGFRVSVVAGGGMYCAPRPQLCSCSLGLDGAEYAPWPGQEAHDYPGPYTAVEVGFPSVRPEPWDEWQEYAVRPDRPTGTVYGQVPVEMVRALVALHGGEAGA